MPKICKINECPYNVFGGGYCKFHQYYRKQSKIIAAKSFNPIRKVSESLRAVHQIYKGLRIKYLRENPLCRCRSNRCTKIATEIHHMRGRGIYLNDTNTWLPACRNCHYWMENHPKKAKELNLSQSRLTNGK